MKLPAPGQVAVWWMAVGDVPEMMLARWLKLLDEEEQAKAARFRFAADRQQYIAAHALTRTMLAAFSGLQPEQLRFWRTSNGRPELEGQPQLRFSLSHTRSLVACAVAHHDPVGLDVESLERNVAGLEIAQSCFAPPEAELVRKSGQESFFRLWTLKEAFIKATGTGLSRPLDSFCISLDPIRIDAGENGNYWRFAQVSPVPGHLLAVALHHPGPGAAQLESRQMALDELCSNTCLC